MEMTPTVCIRAHLWCHMQKNETGPHITPYTRVNCQYIEVLNVRPETIKLPDERIGVTSSTSLLALVFSVFFFFRSDFKGNGKESKNKHKVLYQTKKLLHSEWKTINKIKQPMIGKKCLHIIYLMCVLSRVWLCDPLDCSPPGSAVRGIL